RSCLHRRYCHGKPFMEAWDGDRPVTDPGRRKDRVHGQDVLNEGEIGVIVGQISKGDEAGEQGDCRNRCRLRRTNGNHRHLQRICVTTAAAVRSLPNNAMAWAQSMRAGKRVPFHYETFSGFAQSWDSALCCRSMLS